MDKSPVYPNYKTTGQDYYDSHLDFAQLLKEAKTHHKSSLLHVHASTSKQDEKDQLAVVTTKPNKSWKTCILTWLKGSNKTNIMQPPVLESSLYIKSETRHCYVSGPIKRCTVGQPKRTTSGPLFNQRKTRKEEMPSISLGQLNPSRSYGPVYLVT